MCDGDTKGGEAVQDCDADLDFGSLAIKVASHGLLTEQLHTVHLCLDAASAMVSAPSLPDGSSQSLDGAQSLIPCFGAWAVLLPSLGVLPGRDDSVRPTVRDGIAVATSVVGTVVGD